jgi:hypothetical protein
MKEESVVSDIETSADVLEFLAFINRTKRNQRAD